MIEDRLLWVSPAVASREELVKKLTVDSVQYDGSIKTFCLAEVRDDCVGVPRNWAADNLDIDARLHTTHPHLDWPPICFPTCGNYRDGQEESVLEIYDRFQYRQGGVSGALLEAMPGAGKTLMALDIASRLGTTALVLVHKGDLASQWQRTASAFWPTCQTGHVQQKQLAYKDKHVVTAMAQTVYSQRDTLPDDFFKSFGIVIFDEGHRYSAETFAYSMGAFHAHFRLGVSATWRRKDGLEMLWEWYIGRVESKCHTRALSGNFRQVSWETSLRDSSFYWAGSLNRSKYITTMSETPSLNDWLAKKAVAAADAGRCPLACSDRKAQCEAIKSAIECSSDHSVGLYVGGLTDKQRDEEAAKDIIIATYGMMSEGTDIPRIDTLFLATPRVDIEQVVGRIRRPVAGKKTPLVIDIVFDTPWNRAQAAKRLAQYESFGFTSQG